jgi:hypothetical protein
MDMQQIQPLLDKLPSAHPLARSVVVYDTVTLIAEKRQLLLNDLVAYTNDPVRYKRRMRMLIQLSSYEEQILTKLNKFDFVNDDIKSTISNINWEIQQLVNINA